MTRQDFLRISLVHGIIYITVENFHVILQFQIEISHYSLLFEFDSNIELNLFKLILVKS